MTPLEHIRARIRRQGPLTFAAYMHEALYHPDHGFFRRAPVGERGHFVTSVHVSSLFALLLARQARDTWETLGKPDDFCIVDAGAADGSLLAAMRGHLGDLPVRAIAVDISPVARAAAAARGLETAASVEDLGPFTGLLLANELFDNIPFHRLRGRRGEPVEVLVGTDGDRLIELEGSPTVPPTRHRGEWTASPESGRLLRVAAERLTRGHALLIDYGFAGEEDPEPVRGYRQHRLVADVLATPGETDITGPVDFDALRAAAEAAGLQAAGPVLQRDALMALGYRDALDRLRLSQVERETRGEWRAAIRAFGARGDAAMLVDPRGLGAHKVLGLATPGLPQPRAVED